MQSSADYIHPIEFVINSLISHVISFFTSQKKRNIQNSQLNRQANDIYTYAALNSCANRGQDRKSPPGTKTRIH